MSVRFLVPTQLRRLTAGASEVDVEGTTVGEAIDALEAAHPGFQAQLLDGEGGLKRFVNVYLSDEDVRYLDGLATPVNDGDTVTIIAAVAGGA
jgi:molybdopterin synthase sulfur carrier subunit